jgi:hypothetical protein
VESYIEAENRMECKREKDRSETRRAKVEEIEKELSLFVL